MIAIKLLPAENGDALLITIEEREERGALLIDGGYASTFETSIRPELKALAQLGYHLDLVVVSHIDADHVGGILSLIRANGDATAPKIIKIKQVW